MATSRQLQHFLAAMEQRSLLGAAQSVNLSQPALSKSISVLEEEYGVKFFDRHPRGLEPTVFGAALEFHARRILLDIEQSKRDISSIASGSMGRIRVGAGLAFVDYAEAAMTALDKEYPGVDLTIITDYAEGLRQALLENRIDLFVGMVNPLEGMENFETKIVATDPILGLCHRSHEFAKKDIAIDELHKYDWAVPERGEVVRSALDAFFVSNQSLQPRYRIVTNIPSILGKFVRDNQMISLNPQGSMRDFEPFNLTWFRIKDFDYQRHIGIVRRANIAAPPLADVYRDILITKLESSFDNFKSPPNDTFK